MPSSLITTPTGRIDVRAPHRITILFATETGNAERVADDALLAATRMGLDAHVLRMGEISPDVLVGSDFLLVIASTYGDGESPNHADDFHTSLCSADAPSFAGIRYAVLALGDRAYPTFCGFGHSLDARFSELGATRFAALVECDFDYSEPATEWIGNTLVECASDRAEAEVISLAIHRELTADHLARDRPVLARVIARRPMQFGDANVLTAHIELTAEAKDLAYEPGDALAVFPENEEADVLSLLAAARCAPDPELVSQLRTLRDISTVTQPMLERYAEIAGAPAVRRLATDPTSFASYTAKHRLIDVLLKYPCAILPDTLLAMLRPLAPRSYSIASSPRVAGDRVDLLVARLTWTADGVEGRAAQRHGVGSSHLVVGTSVGSSLRVRLQPNSRFRLPVDPGRPIIMIGAGTGVAPFRAFLQDREATGARGPNWLIFGHRRSRYDFFYHEEWDRLARTGLLSRISTAFSRDQAERIYVQHRLHQERDALLRWLAADASIYVCGAIAMGDDVDMMLRKILSEAGRDGHAELDALQRAGRYLRDVY